MLELFVPKKVGNYVIRPQHILGLEITKSHVYGSLLTYSGVTITLEKTFYENIEFTNENYLIRSSQAVAKIISQLPKGTLIYSSLSSTIAIIKELALPFTDPEKISLILNFELEGFLPFAIQDAVVDFIITDQKTTSQETSILAAATQKKYIKDHIEIFDQLNITLKRLSLDAFDIYGLYHSSVQNNSFTVLINLDQYNTCLEFIGEKSLKNVRTITKGTNYLAKLIAQKKEVSSSQALEELARQGMEKYIKNHQFLSPYFQEITLTLQSFLMQSKDTKRIDSIILLGHGSDILGMDKLFQECLKIPCQVFELHQLMRIPNFQIKNGVRISRAQLISLGTAYESSVTENFNLLRDEFAVSPARYIQKNLFVATGLFILLFLVIVASGFWMRFFLQKTIRSSEQSVIRTLRELQLTDVRDFNRAITDAQEKINKEEDLWFAFSRQQRFSFLDTLQKLSLAIDRKSLGLNLKKLNMTPNEILFEGEVKGFDELKILERELKKSNMFIQVPTLQELKFSERLVLKKNGFDTHEGT